ncbi:MAG TPA: hypothetical protein VHA79_09875 [Mycobacteriales bacterium]|nr:hypothetical protein [Mycobacteriales bacterium]
MRTAGVDVAMPAVKTSRPRAKALKDRIFIVTVTPNTDVGSIAHDLIERIGWTGRMRIRAIWTSLSEPHTVSAVVRYEARGANANDLRQQVTRACPVSGDQIDVVDVVTINLDIDPALVDACLLDLDEDDG